jgi:CRISPR-associated exonuclease Cas4
MMPGEQGLVCLGLAIALLLLGSLLWIMGRGWRADTGLPGGEIIYADSRTWFGRPDTLFAPRFHLAGRPDYLVEEADGTIVPVELKSGLAPRTPHEGHVMQLAAYCLLVEVAYGVRPRYGILQYRDKAFAIDYTADLEGELLDIVGEMSRAKSRKANRSHDSRQRCVHCGVREFCQQRLA